MSRFLFCCSVFAPRAKTKQQNRKVPCCRRLTSIRYGQDVRFEGQHIRTNQSSDHHGSNRDHLANRQLDRVVTCQRRVATAGGWLAVAQHGWAADHGRGLDGWVLLKGPAL